MAKIKAVAIERQYCSGGREIAHLVAKELGCPCYDERLAELTAQKLGVTVEQIVKYEETLASPFLTPMSVKSSFDKRKNLSEIIFETQAQIITTLAKQERCVIVGRCGEYILKNNVPTLSVFICASNETRTDHAVDCHGIAYDDVPAILKKMDKKRADYYRTNTRKDWDSMLSYDMCLNSTKLGFEGAAKVIADIVRKSK